jgi:hypothetical protein
MKSFLPSHECKIAVLWMKKKREKKKAIISEDMFLPTLVSYFMGTEVPTKHLTIIGEINLPRLLLNFFPLKINLEK